MSTPAVIARPTDTGFEGRLVHWDGYPGWTGIRLHQQCRAQFAGDHVQLAAYFVDQHDAWQQIGEDASVPARWVNPSQWPDRDDPARAEDRSANKCYCHGEPGHQADDSFTEADDLSGIEWVYLITADGLIVMRRDRGELTPAGVAPWDHELTSAEWQAIECGPQFEWCGHVAAAHVDGLDDDAGRLPMSVYLGRAPLRPQHACGYLVDGVRVRCTGSGMRERTASGYGDRWLDSVEFPDGHRSDIPVRFVDGPLAGQWAPGVQPIYPEIAA